MVRYFCDLCKKMKKTNLVTLPTLEQRGMNYYNNPLFVEVVKDFDICDNCLKDISERFYEKLKWQ